MKAQFGEMTTQFISKDPYPRHQDHKVHHKASKPLKSVSNMFHVAECAVFTSLQLRVKEVDKMTQLGPRGILNTTISVGKKSTDLLDQDDIKQ